MISGFMAGGIGFTAAPPDAGGSGSSPANGQAVLASPFGAFYLVADSDEQGILPGLLYNTPSFEVPSTAVQGILATPFGAMFYAGNTGEEAILPGLLTVN